MINVFSGKNNLRVLGGFNCEIMNIYRFMNIMYIEVVVRLFVVIFLVSFGFSSKEFFLFDDNEVVFRVGSKSEVVINV